MCTKNSREERARGLVKLRLFVAKLQRGLSLLAARKVEIANMVPEDVKEGHFAVFAVKGGEKKRFVVKLDYLTSPAFLRLLEQAEEEYGFRQRGALAVPCRPEELEKILEDRRDMRAGGARETSSS
ncbi:hypothetical protein UlMin_042928 [Ulmus minor]